MGSVNPSIDLAHDGDIAVVTIDNPPVNALKHEVRAGLIEAFQRVRNDAGVKAAVLACAGRTFSAGADISEFGKPRRSPGLIEVIETIEETGKPVVAALHGTPLGGGFELALGCHYRVAAPGTRVGLPEIKLGLLPGAGGTQRLPRLIGPERALAAHPLRQPDAGRGADRRTASSTRSSTGDVVKEAIAFARKVVAEKRPLTRVRDREDRLAAARADPSGFTRAADASTKRARGLRAVAACVEVGAQQLRQAVRRGPGARARAVHGAPDERGVARPAPHLLRRARGPEGAGHAGRREAARGAQEAASSAPAPWAAASP